MSHLRRLAIRAYRSIVKADLRLGEITVVIGASDVGKSNLVRALRDWSYNAPGTDFATEGQQVTRVAVAVGDSHKVVWEKSAGNKKSAPRYVLADADAGELLSFEKIGLTVPHEVVDVTKVRALEIDDLKVRIHFAEQAEAWFLLSNPPWTAGTVSKVIGRVSGVDALILANRDLVNARTAKQREAKRLRIQADENRALLAEFDGLDERLALLEQAQTLLSKVDRNRAALAEATQLVRRVADCRRRLRVVQGRTALIRDAAVAADRLGLEQSLERLEEARDHAGRLANLRQRALEVARRADRARKALNDDADLLAAVARGGDLDCPICGQPAHPDCRAALADAARAAKPARKKRLR